MSSIERDKERELLMQIDEFNAKQKAKEAECDNLIKQILNELVHLSKNSLVRVLHLAKTLRG